MMCRTRLLPRKQSSSWLRPTWKCLLGPWRCTTRPARRDRIRMCGTQQASAAAVQRGSSRATESQGSCLLNQGYRRIWVEPMVLTAGMRDASSTAVADPKMTFPLDSWSMWVCGLRPTRTIVVTGGVRSVTTQFEDTRSERSPAVFTASTETHRRSPCVVLASREIIVSEALPPS